MDTQRRVVRCQTPLPTNPRRPIVYVIPPTVRSAAQLIPPLSRPFTLKSRAFPRNHTAWERFRGCVSGAFQSNSWDLKTCARRRTERRPDNVCYIYIAFEASSAMSLILIQGNKVQQSAGEEAPSRVYSNIRLRSWRRGVSLIIRKVSEAQETPISSQRSRA